MSDVSIIFISILVIFGVVECIIPIIFTRWREAEYGVVAGMIAGGVVEVLLLLLTFVAFLCHMPEAKITGWACHSRLTSGRRQSQGSRIPEATHVG